MRRILLATLVALFAFALAGAALADEEKTVEKNIALAMTFTGDEAAIGDYVHAMMLVNSLRALGGEIELDGDQLRIRLELGPEQLEALRKALAESESGEGMAGMFGPGMTGRGGAAVIATEPKFLGDENRRIIVMQKEDDEGRKCGSHERFLLGKKHKTPCKGCKSSHESVKKEMKVIVRGDMHEGKPFVMKEGSCKLVVTCPHCGKPVEIDVPMPPEMPGMPVPPGEHVEKFLRHMHPDGEFAPPYPPMPDMDAMRKHMGPMMEQMERFRHERGDMERRFGEMERALDEFHRHIAPRFEERDREVWRAIDELHRLFEDLDREVFSELEELEREQDEELDELWDALDELWEELEELEDELE